MTEDMLEQHASVLINLGTTGDAALLRAKIQSASLLSDMESFKVSGAFLSNYKAKQEPFNIGSSFLSLFIRQQIQDLNLKILSNGIHQKIT